MSEVDHRVVVIDPEDREQIERLSAVIRLHNDRAPFGTLAGRALATEADSLQSALRALTKWSATP